MTSAETAPGYVLAKDAGQAIWTMGEHMVLKATGALTGNAFTVLEDLVAPGGEPPPHVHEREDEAYYLLEGAMDVTIGDQTFQATAGTFVFLPRRILHHWKVVGTGPVRFLVFFTPAGVEGFFLELSEPARAPTPPPPTAPDVPKIVQTAGEYGIRLAEPPPIA